MSCPETQWARFRRSSSAVEHGDGACRSGAGRAARLARPAAAGRRQRNRLPRYRARSGTGCRARHSVGRPVTTRHCRCDRPGTSRRRRRATGVHSPTVGLLANELHRLRSIPNDQRLQARLTRYAGSGSDHHTGVCAQPGGWAINPDWNGRMLRDNNFRCAAPSLIGPRRLRGRPTITDSRRLRPLRRATLTNPWCDLADDGPQIGGHDAGRLRRSVDDRLDSVADRLEESMSKMRPNGPVAAHRKRVYPRICADREASCRD